jgi:hypothetical protein
LGEEGFHVLAVVVESTGERMRGADGCGFERGTNSGVGVLSMRGFAGFESGGVVGDAIGDVDPFLEADV